MPLVWVMDYSRYEEVDEDHREELKYNIKKLPQKYYDCSTHEPTFDMCLEYQVTKEDEKILQKFANQLKSIIQYYYENWCNQHFVQHCSNDNIHDLITVWNSNNSTDNIENYSQVQVSDNSQNNQTHDQYKFTDKLSTVLSEYHTPHCPDEKQSHLNLVYNNYLITHNEGHLNNHLDSHYSGHKQQHENQFRNSFCGAVQVNVEYTDFKEALGVYYIIQGGCKVDQ